MTRRPARTARSIAAPARTVTPRCRCCADPFVAGGILGWAETRAANPEETKTLNAFYEAWILKNPNPPGRTSVRNHLVCCLRRDPSTGKPL